MEVRELRSFLAVIRSGSFTAAAQELGYTQSAVSQHIAALELEVGHRLVERRPVHPTAAGERLVEHAARIVLRVDVARSELTQLEADPQEVVVAVCPLAAPWLLASALREVRATTPSLRVAVRSTDPGSAVAELASGAVHLALVDGIATPDEPLGLADAGLLSSAALAASTLVVVVARNHPLGHRRSIDLDVLADAPWVAAPALVANRPHPALTSSRKPPAVVYEGRDLPTLLALVAAGHGAALLPAASCPPSPDIVAIPLRRPRLVHRTELLTLRNRHRQSTHLISNQLVDALQARAPLSPYSQNPATTSGGHYHPHEGDATCR